MQATKAPCSDAAGLAAGFDKDAAAVKGLLGLGFGFVEVGKPRRHHMLCYIRLSAVDMNCVHFSSSTHQMQSLQLMLHVLYTGAVQHNLCFGLCRDNNTAASAWESKTQVFQTA